MTTLVTGTTGIGGALAAALRARGADVLTVGRTRADIRADLRLMRETAAAADAVRARTDRLDALVCCAGNLSTVAHHTDEGLEATLALNYLSRYLLIRRLLPDIGRVVLVANAGKYPDTLNLDDLQVRGGGRGLWVAGRTQFANDLLTVSLAKRVPAVCVFPGLVATRVFQDAHGVSPALRRVATAVQRRFGTPPDKVGRWLADLVLAPRATTGFAGPRGRAMRVPSRVSAARADGLWAATERVVRPWLDGADVGA
jgi:NAD(P)-dependent dehydrogenase (short-subunit alcohol dehydrogenase family)